MDEPENAAGGQQNVPIDPGMAAAFADFLGYRELMEAASRYGKGYQVTIIKGHNPTLAEPTYRVIIYKVNHNKIADSGGEYYDWNAEGVASTFAGAFKEADRQAKKHQQNPPEA